ncbi:transglycosylase SLT domain-containing protein [Candidatus Woesearchaeota archaeon]|nr:transglycosylase SLT domain-containing protein [Candidatus Woesearchaeota archaeon]
MKEINNYQRDSGKNLEGRTSSYFLNIAKHAFPIVGTLWIYTNMSCAYPAITKINITTSPALENTVLVKEEKQFLQEKRPQAQLPTLQELVQIDPLMEGKYVATSKYSTTISSAEKEYGLPKGLLGGLIMHESEGDRYAVSPVGAAGLSQLMPVTAKGLGLKVWYQSDKPPIKSTGYGDSLSTLVAQHKKKPKELTKVDERFIPEKSIMLGAEYLRQLYDQLGDWDLALKAYNVGPNHKKLHKIKLAYPTSVRKYQEYWNGRNRRLPEFAYIPSDSVVSKL